MKKLQICGIVAGIVGVVLLVVLVAVGAMIKQTVDSTPLSMLEFSLTDAQKNPDHESCSTDSQSYYFWNLTNLADTLNGGKGHYELAGPYVIESTSCKFDQEILSPTIAAHRKTRKGSVFNTEKSKGSLQDKITNANPAYPAILKETGGENGLLVMITGPALQMVFDGMNNTDFATQVMVGALPQTLTGIAAEAKPTIKHLVCAGAATLAIGTVIEQIAVFTGSMNYSLNSFFNSPTWYMSDPNSLPNGLYGFTNWTQTFLGAAPATAVSLDAANNLFNSWVSTQGASMASYAQAYSENATAAAQSIGVPDDTAGLLAAYIAHYLLVPTSFATEAIIDATTEEYFYQQWTNATLLPGGFPLPGGLSGFEVGLPTASNISLEVAMQLWNATSDYSLTTTKGITFWFGVLQNSSLVPSIFEHYPTLDLTQVTMLLTWLGGYYTNVAPYLIRASFGVTTNEDIGYAQWGGLVLGASLRDLQPDALTFYPEIARLDYAALNLPAWSVRYTAAEAKALFTGSHSLLNAVNIGMLLQLVQAGDFTTVDSVFHVNQTKAIALAAYFQYVMENGALPVVSSAITAGSGIYTTRTVQEWIFTGQDPLLLALGQPAGAALGSNTTTTKEQARAKPKEETRIYSKGNTLDELYWSLMPSSEGKVITYYAENITVSGFAGAQFMPFNDVQSPKYPFKLWFAESQRQLELKNVGSTTLSGVNVEHIVVDPSVFNSAATDPSKAKYFQTLAGLWDVRSLPDYAPAPLFLSRVEFLGAEPSVTENITFSDSTSGMVNDVIDNPMSRSLKGMWLEVEPFLGTTVAVSVNIQLNVKVQPTSIFFPKLRPAYAPLFWSGLTQSATEEQLGQISGLLYTGMTMWKVLVALGVVFGVILIVVGIVLYKRGGKKTKVVRLG